MRYLYFFNNISFSITDFGIHGKLYDIKEDNIFDKLNNNSLKNFDSNKIENMAIANVMKFLNVDLQVDSCKRHTTRFERLFFVLDYDIKDYLRDKIFIKKDISIIF